MAAPPPKSDKAPLAKPRPAGIVHSKSGPTFCHVKPQAKHAARPLPPPPQPPEVPRSKRSRGEEPPPPQPPEAPEPKRRRREERSGNHCRDFNFGANACWRDDNCRFWHVTECNYDAILKQKVELGDEKYVTAEIIKKLRKVYAGAKEVVNLNEDDAKEPSRSSEDFKKHQRSRRQQIYEEALDTERNGKVQPYNKFHRDLITLKVDGQVVKRFAYEMATFRVAGVEVSAEVKLDTDVAWCCMLYGTQETLGDRLRMAVVLGYMLRYELKPIMAQSGKRLENVLFVSDISLEKAAIQVVCNFWPLRVVDLPEVHEDRRAATSRHLTVQELDDRHVFLKSWIPIRPPCG